jgi:hypothetical protein
MPVLRELNIVNDGKWPTTWVIDSLPDGGGLYLKADREDQRGPTSMILSCGNKDIVLAVSMTRDNMNNPPIVVTKVHQLLIRPLQKSGELRPPEYTDDPKDVDMLYENVRDLTKWFQRFKVEGDTYVASFLISPALMNEIAAAKMVGYRFDTVVHGRANSWSPSNENYEVYIFGWELTDNDRRKISGLFSNCPTK